MPRSFLTIAALPALGLTAACSNANFTGANALSTAFNSHKSAPSGDEQEQGQETEEKSASTPQPVSGMYLTCAFMDPQPTVRADAATGAPINIGCGLYYKSAGVVKRADLSGTQPSLDETCGDGSSHPLPVTFTASSPLQIATQLKPGAASCKLNLTLAGSPSFTEAAASINRYDAAQSFDPNADIAARGITFTAAGQPVIPDPATSTAAAAPAPTPTSPAAPTAASTSTAGTSSAGTSSAGTSTAPATAPAPASAPATATAPATANSSGSAAPTVAASVAGINATVNSPLVNSLLLGN